LQRIDQRVSLQEQRKEKMFFNSNAVSQRFRFVAAKLSVAALAFTGIGSAIASEGGYPLDRFPTEKMNDQSALQNGAKVFINNCLNCHAASSMRYNRLVDIGLTENQIRENLLFSASKVGDLMKTSLSVADAKAWFGAVPPDLSVIARARSSSMGSGSDWVYTYLRTYYRDSSRATGWNNAVYPNVGMPHILWGTQGQRGATITEVKSVTDEKTKKDSWVKVETKFAVDGAKSEVVTPLEGASHHAEQKFVFDKPVGGSLNQAEYDKQIADLTAYITYMSDPSAKTRTRIGTWVLIALGIFSVFAWQLNRNYWKDIK
jgi:ubiquinol-cytochrome c reductase cytochrome c1 subunit